jgi:colanic acid biosynthesis glycosyl transferase WcaI
MNILIVSQYFYPEIFRINDLANEFQSKGHQLTILTGTPNYPSGQFFDGYGIFKKNIDNYKGMRVLRCPLIPRGSASSLRLVLNYVSFVFSSIIASLFLLNKDYDIIFVFEPSPITVCLPAIFIKKIKKIPICFWVLDLWPESVISAGNFKTENISKLLNPLVKFIYNHSDKILVSSQGFIKSIVAKGISKKKITYLPQWAETLFKPVKNHGNELSFIPNDSFKIMFAGNIGEAQDFPSIIKCASILKKYQHIHWIILGDGRKKEWVQSEIKKQNLESNFHLLGKFPLEKMPSFYSQADCMLFSLKKDDIFSITVPAKVQTYLACAKPIIAMIDGEASKIIIDSKAGFVSPSQSPVLLAKNIKKISLLSQNELNKLGKKAFNYYKSEFERSFLIEKIEKILKNMIKKKV